MHMKHVELFEYTNYKDDKCLTCNKNWQIKFDEKLKEIFFNTYKFCNHTNNKCILLLQKGLYPYEDVDNWAKFNEISLPEKEDFYSHLKKILLMQILHMQKEFVKILK